MSRQLTGINMIIPVVRNFPVALKGYMIGAAQKLSTHISGSSSRLETGIQGADITDLRVRITQD
jgi:hypothetical protein